MKKIATIVVGLVLAAGLTGCYPNGSQTENTLNVEVVKLPDDSTVDCVYSGSGVDCDWNTRG